MVATLLLLWTMRWTVLMAPQAMMPRRRLVPRSIGRHRALTTFGSARPLMKPGGVSLVPFATVAGWPRVQAVVEDETSRSAFTRQTSTLLLLTATCTAAASQTNEHWSYAVTKDIGAAAGSHRGTSCRRRGRQDGAAAVERGQFQGDRRSWRLVSTAHALEECDIPSFSRWT